MCNLQSSEEKIVLHECLHFAQDVATKFFNVNFSGKDIEIALTELRQMQLHIDSLVQEERANKNQIQKLLETKYQLEK